MGDIDEDDGDKCKSHTVVAETDYYAICAMSILFSLATAQGDCTGWIYIHEHLANNYASNVVLFIKIG